MWKNAVSHSPQVACRRCQTSRVAPGASSHSICLIEKPTNENVLLASSLWMCESSPSEPWCTSNKLWHTSIHSSSVVIFNPKDWSLKIMMGRFTATGNLGSEWIQHRLNTVFHSHLEELSPAWIVGSSWGTVGEFASCRGGGLRNSPSPHFQHRSLLFCTTSFSVSWCLPSVEPGRQPLLNFFMAVLLSGWLEVWCFNIHCFSLHHQPALHDALSGNPVTTGRGTFLNHWSFLFQIV